METHAAQAHMAGANRHISRAGRLVGLVGVFAQAVLTDVFGALVGLVVAAPAFVVRTGDAGAILADGLRAGTTCGRTFGALVVRLGHAKAVVAHLLPAEAWFFVALRAVIGRKMFANFGHADVFRAEIPVVRTWVGVRNIFAHAGRAGVVRAVVLIIAVDGVEFAMVVHTSTDHALRGLLAAAYKKAIAPHATVDRAAVVVLAPLPVHTPAV